MPSAPNEHASNSSVQRLAEAEILDVLQERWNVRFEDGPQIDRRVDLDGFVDGANPICVEAWAHQGRAKGGQKGKVMRDFCKLLLVEKLLGKPCRKIFVACDSEALAFLNNSWMGHFADEFGIERIVVDVSGETRQRIRNAQQKQRR
ncbi:MAG: hypothetical protein ACE5KM_24470 [Planctomycetaceae bacterium]